MMINCSKKLAYELLLHTSIVILFLLLSFVINKIPDGTFVAGGDFYQLIDINYNYDMDLYTWFNQAGQGEYNLRIVAFPFYALQYILYNIGFSYGNIANTIMFLFLIGSFYSFFFAIRIIETTIPNNIRLLSSAIYSINIFTFTIFTYPWWITHHFLIYIFIPLLLAFFEKLVSRCSAKDILYYSIVFLISTVGFGNIAFLAALIFFQLLLSIAFSATQKIPFNLKTIKRILFIFALQLFLSIYFILPYFASQFEYASKISSGKVMGDLAMVLPWTSNNVYSIFSFTMLKDKYPLVNLYSWDTIVIAISIGYIIFLIITLLCHKKNEYKNWLHYLIFYMIYLFLLMRATVPFNRVNVFLYTLQGFNLFRSPDKLFVFYPFFYLVILSLSLYYSKFSKKIITAILIIILVIPFPFYIGGITKYLSYEDQDGYRNTVQIPPEYYAAKKIVNRDNSQLSIISLPYSVVLWNNWANYPKWHFVGHDVLYLLYNKFYISANKYDHQLLETNLSFKEYNDAKITDSVKFLRILQKFSGRYIFLHKDINKYWLGNSKAVHNTIKDLESKNIIKRLDDNEYFTLYELNKKYWVPLISSDKYDVYFQKISPVKYIINIYNLKEKTTIEFHQSHNSQWKLYLKSNPNNSWCKPLEYYENTKTTECEHIKKIFDVYDLSYIWKKPVFDDTHTIVNEYANGWTIDSGYIKANYPKEFYKENLDGSVEIEMVLYFKPQSYFHIGLFITGLTFIGCFVYFSWFRNKRKIIKLLTEDI